MVTKKTEQKPDPFAGRYTIAGRMFTWTTDDGAEVTIPLRLKMRVLRQVGATRDDMDVNAMFGILDAIAPDQADLLDDMDVNDFQDMFSTWQTAYGRVTGASLGESGSSSV